MRLAVDSAGCGWRGAALHGEFHFYLGGGLPQVSAGVIGMPGVRAVVPEQQHELATEPLAVRKPGVNPNVKRQGQTFRTFEGNNYHIGAHGHVSGARQHRRFAKILQAPPGLMAL